MHYLFIITQAPYQSSLARETLDLALASAAFEQQVSVLFMADGVLQLMQQQRVSEGQKNIAKTLSSFELFDIKHIFACKHSIATRALDRSMFNKDLENQLEFVDAANIQLKIAAADKVFNFLWRSFTFSLARRLVRS